MTTPFTGSPAPWAPVTRSEHTPGGRQILPHYVERTDQGLREYDPYAKLFEERIVFLGIPLDDTAADDVMGQMIVLESKNPDRDISLYINSPGGSFTALTAIYDTMQFIRPDIQTVCLGQAASAAAVLLMAGTPGKRLAVPGSRVLLRQPSIEGIKGQTSDLEIQARELMRMREWLEQTISRHTGRPVEQAREDIERDMILTAEQAVAYGAVDQITVDRKVARTR
jgi:ATP-dependent Clp protease protease subunit